jgi:prepilin-type N-terminal cleavage/methylation domain-containing protein
MNKGFTLTEILAVLAIFTLISGAIYSGYNFAQKAYTENESLSEINQNGRVVLERMAREIRQARDIVTDLPDSSDPQVSSIEFEDGHVQELYRYIRYFKDEDSVMREEIKYYFPSDPDTFVFWNASSTSETVSSTTIKGPEEIGEYVSELKFWSVPDINIFLRMGKNSKESVFKTSVFGRNL